MFGGIHGIVGMRIQCVCIFSDRSSGNDSIIYGTLLICYNKMECGGIHTPNNETAYRLKMQQEFFLLIENCCYFIYHAVRNILCSVMDDRNRVN